MKIICIGRNYADHARELNNPLPAEPVVFLKPDTALLQNNAPFYLPRHLGAVHYEVEVVLRICKEGKHIPERFAGRYYDAAGLGVDLTARDLQQRLREKGLPWELAKGFDHSAPVSRFLPLESLGDPGALSFRLHVNGGEVQEGNTAGMIFPFDRLISHVSTYITLRKGDLLFTGTPGGVGAVAVGDHLEGWLEDKKLLDFHIK